MDEDDSQDELINRSASHNKGKRAAVWAISDDSDDNGADSEEGESDSSEEGEDHQDQEDDDDDEEDDDEEEEDEDENDDEEEGENAKAEGGAFGGTSADLGGMSSDEDADKCPICLNSFSTQPVATPESCEHYFCLDCILEWTKNANSCPVDRIAFNSIYLRKCFGGKVKKVITVQKPVKEGQEDIIDMDFEQTNCEVCGGSDREDRLLLCDGCDAGYHMECLTPPLDSVPVEEWFCPECVANNRHSRGSAEEISDTESLPSTSPTTSRSQSRAAGPTRAIARTQQSERVRANVNRHRITQARSAQLAPTYLMQSTWLDETINAVVAGLNTSVYIRNLTPRIPSSRRRKTGRRRKVKRSSSAKGKKVAGTGVRRRKRRVRRSKSRKKLVLKKSATPRSRIANNLGIVKDQKSSSLPMVYRPAENRLSNMRAEIGAQSLSIYGDPFDLDPFVDREEDDHQTHATSLLEAKRRGISRSALRSHQPVARPVTGSLSRRAVDVPQSVGVVEAAPVPDLLGSILTGQSMLLMDSSDIVINRDGSLKAAKPVAPSVSTPGCSKSNISADASTHINSVMPTGQGDASVLPHYNTDLPGSSHNTMSRPFSQSSSRAPPSASRSQPSHLPPRGHPNLQPVRPNRPSHPPAHRTTNGGVDLTPDSGSNSNQPKKAPTKPMWVDVAVLPRIPKIRRESSDSPNRATSQGASIVSNTTRSRENSSTSTPTSHVYGMPDTGTTSLAGNKGRQQSVDQQKGRAESSSQRQRPGGTGSSNSFSNSFSSSSSSSSTGFPSSQSRFSSSSSASSSVSFRINSSGNSWQSRRLSMASSSATGGSMQEHWNKKEDEVRKRQMHRDKQMLLASHTQVKKEEEEEEEEEESNNIYDPFNPTLSDSDSDAESSVNTTQEVETQAVGNKKGVQQSKQDLVHVKTEKQDLEVSPEEPRTSSAPENMSQQIRRSEVFIKTENETRSDTERQREMVKIKKEKELEDPKEAQRFGCSVNLFTAEPMETRPSVHHSQVRIKAERETMGLNEGGLSISDNTVCKSSSAPSSAPPSKKQKTEIKPDSKSSSKSPTRDSGSKKKTPQVSKEGQSSSSEADKGRRGDHHALSHTGQQKEKEKEKKKQDRNSRRSRSREKRARSTSESSQSNSPDRTSRKRQPSSRSKDRRRSRSDSSSSSRDRSRRKKHGERSKEKNDGREKISEKRQESKNKRPGRSRSKSRSKSRSRSRSKDHKRGRSHSKSRSRSRSRERKRDNTRLQQSSLPSKDKAESRSKEKRAHTSRSSSRERRKEKGSSSNSSQRTSSSSVLPSHDTKPRDRKKDKDVIRTLIKDEKVDKEEVSLCIATSKTKKEELRTDSQAKPAEVAKEIKPGKEIKKEKRPSLDMFEDSPSDKPIKEETANINALVEVKEESKDVPVKTETCEILIIKTEPSSPQPTHPAPVTSFPSSSTPVTAESPQDKVAQCHPEAPAEKENSVGSTVSVKQEPGQPSDSDDDFNVDVMLDNLDYVKSEPKEGSGSSLKTEKAAQEGKNEGEQGSVVVGTKSKTQVKRVTWNIQEPEGPQPEKSASKVALYKLRLKQEGLRRPSSTSQTSSQDITGSVGDPSKKSASSSSISDVAHTVGLSNTGQTGEEDMLSKDKQYLKKLHMQERAVEEVKLAIKPFYQRRDINKEEYKEILRKAVQKVCHSKSGEINPVKVGNLVKAYVDKYKHARKHKKGEDLGRTQEAQTEVMKTSDSP